MDGKVVGSKCTNKTGMSVVICHLFLLYSHKIEIVGQNYLNTSIFRENGKYLELLVEKYNRTKPLAFHTK